MSLVSHPLDYINPETTISNLRRWLVAAVAAFAFVVGAFAVVTFGLAQSMKAHERVVMSEPATLSSATPSATALPSHRPTKALDIGRR
jgi:hypothetical protein